MTAGCMWTAEVEARVSQHQRPCCSRIELETLAFQFWIFLAVPEKFAIKVGGCIKSTELLHVFGTPKFWNLHYKIQPVSDHVAKFHGDRPRDLGDYAFEKKKHHGQNRRYTNAQARPKNIIALVIN